MAVPPPGQFIHQLHSLFLSFYFLLVLQAPSPKFSPNSHKCTLAPEVFLKFFFAKERATREGVTTCFPRFAACCLSREEKLPKILWDQGSTNEPARRLGGLRRLRDFVYSHFSTCKIHNTMLFSQAHFRPRYGTPENCFFQMSSYWTAEERSVQWGT